ncbi:hypothetical protein [Paenibacillus lutimineralis]|uniref:WD40 repeat domain-containing protein n=1 Tax=Paenibacillus lutimineralis TaxID=2707005 RepID=A0A3Q9ICD1_9BACL|nr:hypothetical protein [Paenibacillus lutimineralis]AZS15905.1 hypothetical protein EI981_16655 [Paenibacillus lutimineralis]
MRRIFQNSHSHKTWEIDYDGNRVVMSNNGGKPREKLFVDSGQAAKYAEKEMWSKLKKGFIYRNSEAAPGTPLFHLYIGAGYTGFMPLAAIADTNQFYAGYVVGQFEKEEIYHLDEHGQKQVTWELAGNHLIYDMFYCLEAGKLLINDSHKISGISMDGSVRSYTSFTYHNSTLSLSGNRGLWYDGSHLLMTDLLTQERLYRTEATPEIVNGHSPQLCAALSRDGRLMAYCTHPDDIIICDMETGSAHSIAKDISAMTTAMDFSADNRYLFTQEQYGSWELACYDMNTLTRRSEWKTDHVRSFAVHPTKPLLAIFSFGKVQLYHTESWQRILEFKPEHVVKNCKLVFTKDYLALYSDYGCISLYAI